MKPKKKTRDALNDVKYLTEVWDMKPTTPPAPLVSEYVEGHRILPPNTPFPGYWQNSRTPYLIEPMDNMSPFNPTIETTLMKGAQLGFTASAENVIAYWMDEIPSEILYISSTESLLTKWAIKRLDPLIDSCGYRHKIFAQTENKKTRRSGDRTFTKEYVGGTLDMASAQSASSLRSDSKRILVRDEIDGAPVQLRTGEGNWIDVSKARTNAWGARKKIYNISTPTLEHISIIHQLYMAGDQRKFFVPCPICKKMQVLEFGDERSKHGIKADMEAGLLKEAFYICKHCGEVIFNHDKGYMLMRGEWRPTAKSSEKHHRSYHISSLYSPVGMLSWTELYQEYLKAQKDPVDGMRSFVNLYLGMPYKEQGSRPDLAKVIELRGGYGSGTVPKGVLYITAGVDVQTGSKTDPSNPPRLEMEVLGIGPSYRTWSIMYRRFEGAVDNPHEGAWKDFRKWIQEGNLEFTGYNGNKFNCGLMFIDSGDGNLTDAVYQFTFQIENCFPSKGFSALRKKSREEGDPQSLTNFKRYRALKVNDDTTLYEISTNYYKKNIYRSLRIKRSETGVNPPGYCDFPADYSEKYFKMLTAEDMHRDGSFHCPSGRRNEALDCRVYALCAGDIYLDAKLMNFKAALKSKGASQADIDQVTHRSILEILCKKQGLTFF